MLNSAKNEASKAEVNRHQTYKLIYRSCSVIVSSTSDCGAQIIYLNFMVEFVKYLVIIREFKGFHSRRLSGFVFIQDTKPPSELSPQLESDKNLGCDDALTYS